MTRARLLQFWLTLFLPVAAFAQERFPPPELPETYRTPPSATPLPRLEWLGYLDVAVLAAALALTGYLSLKKRSRAGVFGVMLFSIAYFGFFRKGCVCSVGSIQDVALALGRHDYALPLTVAAFFLLPLLAALFVGRAFCAGACPLGAVQDLVLLKPVKVPEWLEHALGLLAYIYLGGAILYAALGSAFLICKYDPIVPLFRLDGPPLMLTLAAVLLGVGVFVGRPYCRFFCPYGVLLRWLSPFAKWRVTITPERCIQCRLCEESCPFGAVRPPTPPGQGDPREGKRRLAWLIALLPVLIAAGGVLGHFSAPVLARQDGTVRLANRIWLEEHGKVMGYTTESEAYSRSNSTNEELFQAAAVLRKQYDLGAALFGAWVGLVIGLKLIFLAVRRRRTEYEADPAACLACGRCYRYCPKDAESRAHVLEHLG